MKAKSKGSATRVWIWGVFLWLIVPVTLFFVAYKFIGPNIGQVPQLKASAEKVEQFLSRDTSPEIIKPSQKEDDGPKPIVDIEVEKAKGSRKRDRSKSSETRTESSGRTRNTARTEAPVEHDEASVDGTMPDDPPSDAASTTGGG